MQILGLISDISDGHSGLLHHFSTDLRLDSVPFLLMWKEGCTQDEVTHPDAPHGPADKPTLEQTPPPLPVTATPFQGPLGLVFSATYG